jgi:hypothetical protein
MELSLKYTQSNSVHSKDYAINIIKLSVSYYTFFLLYSVFRIW